MGSSVVAVGVAPPVGLGPQILIAFEGGFVLTGGHGRETCAVGVLVSMGACP